MERTPDDLERDQTEDEEEQSEVNEGKEAEDAEGVVTPDETQQ